MMAIIASECVTMNHEDLVSLVFFVAFLIVMILFYFVPSFVAGKRHHPSDKAILALNLLLGWSVIGWLFALIWALTGTSGANTFACPFCAEPIRKAARICKHCGRDLAGVGRPA